MLDSFKLDDTEQTKRMKNLVLGGAYVNLEMYKLLNYENLHKLVPKIQKGEIKLPSDLVYGKYTITKEEKFLENMDHYISYVKNNYFIDSIEMVLLIELSLNNKYSNILFSLKDFHQENNYDEYFDKFRKMFFYNLYNNIVHYSKYVDNNFAIKKMKKHLESLDYDNEKDIKEIEHILKLVIENRKNNIYNCFVPYKEVKRKEINFYIHQIDWLLEDYYRNCTIESFVITNKDRVLITPEGTKLIFNINSKVSSLKENDDVNVDFGIKNNNFNSIIRGNLFTKKELLVLLDRLKNIKRDSIYEEEFSFLNATLKFTFWSERSQEYLDIQFSYKQNSCDSYTLALDEKEIESLYILIYSQI